VESHRLCPMTHALLAAGRCRFCGRPFVHGALAAEGASAVPAIPEWDVTKVIKVLADNEDKVGEALSVIFCHEGDLFADLPFLRVASGLPAKGIQKTLERIVRLRCRGFLETDAQRCEQHLEAQPEEFVLRLALLGYYFTRASHFPADRAARQRHSLWVIEHRPETEVAGSPNCYIAPKEGEPYRRAKELWLRHAGEPGVTAKVLGNAANFFTINEPSLSKRFLKRAMSLDPENPAWPERLSFVYSLQSRSSPLELGRSAAKSLKHLDQARRLTRDDLNKTMLLMDTAKAALRAGEFARARETAEALLRAAAKVEWPPADLLHCAHTVLGRLALREGDVDAAKCQLALAAEALATKQGVHPPGPRELRLAQELLERGERAAVINYLNRCRASWEGPWHRAKDWISAIQHGEKPDFAHFME
jgi:hypothetical protein